MYYITTSVRFDPVNPRGGFFTPDYDEAVRIFKIIIDMHTFPYIAVVNSDGEIITSCGNDSF